MHPMKTLDIQKSVTHLLKPKYNQFLSFCQAHENIATLFGSASSCSQKAAMCQQKCKKHRKYIGKHQYLEVETFLTIIEQIRKKYRQYHRLYVYEMIPAYVQKIKTAFISYIQQLLTIDEDTVLLHSFFDELPAQQIQNLITQRFQDWEINDLVCKDISHLEATHKKIISKTLSMNKIKIQNQLDNKFIKILAENKIIIYQEKKTYHMQPEMHQEFESIKNGIERMKKLQNVYLEDPNKQLVSISVKVLREHTKKQRKSAKRMDSQKKNKKQDMKKTSSIDVKIEEQVNSTDKEKSNNSVIPSLQIQQVKIPSIGELSSMNQINSTTLVSPPPAESPQKVAQINQFLEVMTSLIINSKIQYLYLYATSTIDYAEFWKKFYQMFSKDKIHHLQYIIIITPKKDQLKNLFDSFHKSFLERKQSSMKILLEPKDFFKKIM